MLNNVFITIWPLKTYPQQAGHSVVVVAVGMIERLTGHVSKMYQRCGRRSIHNKKIETTDKNQVNHEYN